VLTDSVIAIVGLGSIPFASKVARIIHRLFHGKNLKGPGCHPLICLLNSEFHIAKMIT
jgi:hypothetical protein